MALNQTAFVVCSLRARNGKTTLSRAIAEYLTLTRSAPIVFDTDAPQGTIVESFPGRSVVVELDRIPGQMKLYDTMLSGFSDTYVIDVSHRYFDRFFESVKSIGLEQEASARGLEIVVFYILDRDRSARAAYSILQNDYPGIKFVAVDNLGLARNSLTGESELTSDAVDLNIPQLDATIFPIVGDPSFSMLRFMDQEPENISIVARAAIRDWIRTLFDQLQRVSLKITLSGSGNWLGR